MAITNNFQKFLKLDIEKSNCSTPAFSIMQGSKYLQLAIMLTRNDEIIKDIPSSATVSATIVYNYSAKNNNCAKTTSKPVKYKTTGTIQDGIMIIDFDDNMSTSAGLIYMVVEVIENSKILYSVPITYTIQNNPALEDSEPIGNLTTLQTLIDEVTKMQTNKANNNLSNVSDSIFSSKATQAGITTTENLNDGTKYFTAPDSEEAGRLRYDTANKNWVFEAKDNGTYKEKFRVGSSAIVDVVRLIEGDRPANILPNEIALYNKAVIIDGQQTIRPHFVLPNNVEYSFVVYDEQQNKVVFRNNQNKLIEIPITPPIQRTYEEIALGINRLSGDARVDYNSLKNTPSIDTGGATQFVNLTDTPPDYTGNAGKVLEVNPNENGVIFVDHPAQSGDIINAFFKQKFGIIAEVLPNSNFVVGQFVNLLPNNKDGYYAKELDYTQEYQGQKIGFVSKVDNSSKINVCLEGTIWTGIQNVSEGDNAYLGLPIASSILQISNTKVFDKLYGKVGTFGQEKTGLFYCTFSLTELQISFFAKEREKIVAYYETSDPVIIDPTAEIVNYKFQGQATVIQDLPQLDSIPSGSLYFIGNYSNNYNDILRLRASSGDTVVGSSTYDINGMNTHVVLIAGDEWYIWQKFDKTDGTGKMPIVGLKIQDAEGTIFNDVSSIESNAFTMQELGEENGIKNYELDFRMDNFAKKDLSNVLATDFDSKVRADQAYKQLAARTNEHPSTIKSSFMEHEYNVNSPQIIANLDGDNLIINYTGSQTTIIQQNMPPASSGKTFIVNFVIPDGVTQSALEIMPRIGENINGSPRTLSYIQSTFVGVFIPIVGGGYELINSQMLHDNGITFNISDTESITSKEVQFDNSTIEPQADGSVTIKPGIKIIDDELNEYSTSKLDFPRSIVNQAGDAVTIIPPEPKPEIVEGYLAYLNEEEFMMRSFSGKTERLHKLWFSFPLIYRGTDIIKNDGDHTITLKPGTYLISLRMYYRGTTEQDGNINLYLWDTLTQDYVRDINNQTIDYTKPFKATDKLGAVQTVNIVKIDNETTFEMYHKDNLIGEDLIAEDRNLGGSGIVVQKLEDGKETISLMQYEDDTEQSIEWAKHTLEGPIATTTALINSSEFENEVTVNANNWDEYFGWIINSITSTRLRKSQNSIIIQDNNSPCAFIWGKIFSKEQTFLLRNQVIRALVQTQNVISNFNVKLAKWTGPGNEYTNRIITDIDSDGTPTVAENWTLIDSGAITINAQDSPSEINSTANFTVPNDANNFAVVIYPALKEHPMILELKYMEISVPTAVEEYVITGARLDNEKHLQFDKSYKEYITKPFPGANGWIVLPLANTMTELLLGEPKSGDAPISFFRYQPGAPTTSWQKWEGRITFNANGKVSVTYYFAVQQFGGTLTSGQSTDVNLWFDLQNADGSRTEIQGSRVSQNITASDFSHYSLGTTFEFDVTNGQSIRGFGTSSVSNAAKTLSDSDIKITFEVETEQDTEFLQFKSDLQQMRQDLDAYIAGGAIIGD